MRILVLNDLRETFNNPLCRDSSMRGNGLGLRHLESGDEKPESQERRFDDVEL